MIEEWRPVRGFDGFEVSNLGRVRSLPRRIVRSRNGAIEIEGRVRTLELTKFGYLRIGLGKKNVAVHRLVAQAFVENPNDKPFVNHRDGQRARQRKWSLRRLRSNSHHGRILSRDNRGRVSKGK